MPEENLFHREVMTVSQLTGRLQNVIEAEFGLVLLVGEISNFRKPGSGHLYFVLKDEQAQIRGVMFRNQQKYLGFDPRDGLEVLVRGRLAIYAPRANTR